MLECCYLAFQPAVQVEKKLQRILKVWGCFQQPHEGHLDFARMLSNSAVDAQREVEYVGVHAKRWGRCYWG